MNIDFLKLILLLIFVYIVLHIINNLLSNYEHMSMKDNYFKNELNKNNIEIDIDNLTIKKCDTYTDNNNKCKIKKYSTKNFNSLEAHRFAKNKHLSNQTFMENDIPVPKHEIIDYYNKEQYINSNKIKFPCVLKPIDGMQGKDVNTFIKNIKQFNSILVNLLSKYDKVMYEEQVYGDNYRIFIFNDKVMDIIKREQPFIIGDGKTNIEDLINNKNELQKKMKLYAITNISWDYIEENGYTKNDILEDGKKLFITNTINFHNGANPVRIDLTTIPKENIDMFIKAHKLGKLDVSGIDYMSPDITIPYNENEGHIIEINDMVDTKIHIDADNKSNPRYLYKNIVENLFV